MEDNTPSSRDFSLELGVHRLHAKFSCTTGHIPQTRAPRRKEPASPLRDADGSDVGRTAVSHARAGEDRRTLWGKLSGRTIRDNRRRASFVHPNEGKKSNDCARNTDSNLRPPGR